VKGPAALSGLERATPEAIAVAVLGPHPDEIAAALAGHHAEPHHAD